MGDVDENSDDGEIITSSNNNNNRKKQKTTENSSDNGKRNKSHWIYPQNKCGVICILQHGKEESRYVRGSLLIGITNLIIPNNNNNHLSVVIIQLQ